MKKIITATAIAAAAVLGALVACDTPAFAAGEQIVYQFCSDTREVSTLNWFDADNDQVSRSNLLLSRREAGRWCGSVSLTSRSTYQLVGSAIQTEGTYASCSIAIDGVLKDSQYATGRYAVAVCGA